MTLDRAFYSLTTPHQPLTDKAPADAPRRHRGVAAWTYMELPVG
jgi:hypothetical protein